jgi:hypothetical protein
MYGDIMEGPRVGHGGNAMALRCNLQIAAAITSIAFAFAGVLAPSAQAASRSAAAALVEMLAAPGAIGHEMAAFSGSEAPEPDTSTTATATPSSASTGTSCLQLVCLRETSTSTPSYLSLTNKLEALEPLPASPGTTSEPTGPTGGTEATPPATSEAPPGASGTSPGATGGAQAPGSAQSEEPSPPLAEPHSHVSSGQ